LESVGLEEVRGMLDDLQAAGKNGQAMRSWEGR
jgi:hypothetical protein